MKQASSKGIYAGTMRHPLSWLFDVPVRNKEIDQLSTCG